MKVLQHGGTVQMYQSAWRNSPIGERNMPAFRKDIETDGEKKKLNLRHLASTMTLLCVGLLIAMLSWAYEVLHCTRKLAFARKELMQIK